MNYSTFDTLTVRQYQTLYALHKSEASDEDKMVNSICILTGLSEQGVDELPLPMFNKIGKELSEIFKEGAFASLRGAKPKSFITIAGSRYGITYQPETLTSGQYTEIQTWMRTNVVENMHKIMATIVYPVKGRWIFAQRLKYNAANHPKISEAILECNFIDVHATCVFFSKCWRDSINSLADFLTKEAMSKGMKQEQIQMILKNASAGFLTLEDLQTTKG